MGQSINSHLKLGGGSHLIVFRLMLVYSQERKKWFWWWWGSGVPLQKRNYKNEVGLRSVKPSGVIYCTLKAHSGIYSGSGDFPCKACRLDP